MPILRPMHMSDLPQVLKIIHAHDEDDGEAAEADFHASGFEHQFVFDHDDTVIGVTGFRSIDATDHTAWLSWTYLKQEYRGQGHGKSMTEGLIEKLRADGGRKLFVKVSTYEDPEKGKIYDTALKMYNSLGFTEEVTNIDFYDEDENQIILGLHLADEIEGENIDAAEEKPIIRFNGLYEIAETEGSFTFKWTVLDSIKLFQKRAFTVEDLEVGLDSVKNDGGRKVFLTFPSNLPLIHQPLQAAGFKFTGQLSHYYEQGVHEMHFVHDLNN